MGTKTKFGFVACAAAGLIASAGFAYADAQAQEGDTQIQVAPQPEATDAPVFISEEVVQPLPETAKTDAAAEPDNAEAAFATAKSLRELMTEVDAPRTMSRELECLAGAVYFESRGEPIEGQLAVAQVIVNRAESSAFPSDYCGVVTQRSQFSFVKNGRIPTRRSNAGAWERARKIARIAHEGLWDSEARDSLYFHATYVRPRWARTKQARATIKSHVFYR
tara:strand:+ start:600 stop:1262 length:663 start_codon:yes stop_codon:yes gene_type:complete